VLPVGIGDATKAIGALLHSGKEYICLMELHGDIPEQRVRDVLAEFIGQIYQRPPLRASVKRETRKRTVYEIEILEVEGRRVLFRVSCQAGTYIRKLVHDVGEVLAVGAHMRELRRIRAGPFTESKHIYSLHQLVSAIDACRSGDEGPLREVVRPVEEALEHIPKIWLRDSAVDAVCHGADLAVPGIVKLENGIRPKQPIALLTLKGELIALGVALMSDDQLVDQERGIAAKTVRVVMPRGTYPRMWKANPEKTKSAS